MVIWTCGRDHHKNHHMYFSQWFCSGLGHEKNEGLRVKMQWKRSGMPGRRRKERRGEDVIGMKSMGVGEVGG